MKMKTMRKQVCGIGIAVVMLTLYFASPALALGNSESQSYTPGSFRGAVARKMNHRLSENETVIADATWLWYDEKQKRERDRDTFAYAVERGADNCSSPAILTAAKAGKFGEKVLKALIVTADA
jgi:hypothetical protein